uniref:Uncharacterized protein n=1 Tax=Lactuca sativa TaxID=4236 RepID=A0A9R1X009_LACSA|nr:hypothetical protein LSAT_V11C800398080 [Lactuca sativa]
MEEELRVWKKPKPKEEVKLTKLRASIQMVFEVFVFTTPQAQVEEENEDEELGSSDEKEHRVSKGTKLDKMKVDLKRKVDEKSQGFKRKQDSNDNPKKKGNLKKAYRRRVATY